MPTRCLPPKPSLVHLKHQAADLLSAHAARDPQALHRLREFLPRFRAVSDESIAGAQLKLSDALLAIAREYGFPSWPRLKAFVEDDLRDVLNLPAHERINEPVFRRAVDMMDAGGADELRVHLRRNPQLVHRHVELLGGNYFQTPTLLEFIAENPTRRGSLPANAAEIATIILDAGAAADRASLDSALALVASSRVARECHVQRDLIRVLYAYGADPNAGVLPALLYGEFESVDELFSRGAQTTLIAAAALGKTDDVRRLVTSASDDEQRLALALAAQHGRMEATRLLLEGGVDANGFIPVEGHAHATVLHQAALTGNEEIARLLLERGARRDVHDILHNATAADWAEYAGHTALAALLR